jgi:hypothetical protein
VLRDAYRTRIDSGGGRRGRGRGRGTSVPLPGLLADLPLEEREVLLERPPGHGWTATPEQPVALDLPAAGVGDPSFLMTLM